MLTGDLYQLSAKPQHAQEGHIKKVLGHFTTSVQNAGMSTRQAGTKDLADVLIVAKPNLPSVVCPPTSTLEAPVLGFSATDNGPLTTDATHHALCLVTAKRSDLMTP